MVTCKCQATVKRKAQGPESACQRLTHCAALESVKEGMNFRLLTAFKKKKVFQLSLLTQTPLIASLTAPN